MSFLDNLFNKKPKTAEPIMEALGTDMHCHLVPMVDDGSKSVEETIHCLRTLQLLGYKKVYITPHFNFPRYPNREDDILHRFDMLKKEVEKRRAEEGLMIDLAGVAGEYRVDDGFPEKIKNESFLKIADKYVLIELSLHQHRLGVPQTVFDMQMKGYEIILAHPERYPYYSKHSTELAELKNAGVYFQLNFPSISGFYGEGARQRALDYLENGWIDFLGSDMHNTLYAKAASDGSHDRTLKNVMGRYEFINKTL